MTSTGLLLAELRERTAELATPSRVFVAAGRFTEPDPDLPELAVRIRALLAGTDGRHYALVLQIADD